MHEVTYAFNVEKEDLMSESHLSVQYKDAVPTMLVNRSNILSIFPEDTTMTNKSLVIHCMVSTNLIHEHSEDWYTAVKVWIHVDGSNDKNVSISDIKILYNKILMLFPSLPEDVVRRQIYRDHRIIEFHGDMEDLKRFMQEHKSIVYIKRTSEYVDGEIKIQLFTYSNRYIHGYLTASQLIDENDLNELVNENIHQIFKRKCKERCSKYAGPIAPRRDKMLGINYSVEKEIIRHDVIDGHSNLSSEYIMKVINKKDVINKYVCSDKIKLSFMKEDGEFNSCITARVPIVSCQKTRQQVIEILTKNRKKIDKIILNAIKEHRTFIKSGIDINWLECSSLVLTTSMELVYTFDIKKGIRNIISECCEEEG